MPPIVDAHHHFVDPERIAYHFLEHLPELRRLFGPDDLAPLLREAGVDRTVCVQADDSERETDFMLAQAARVDWVAGVVGWVPLVDPEATQRSVERHRADGSRLRGVRHPIHEEPDDDWAVSEPVLESLGILASHALAFDLSAFKPRHIEHAATFAERVPDLDVVICHMGMPRVERGEWEPWAGRFAAAAQNPRCQVKISGMDMYLGGCSAPRTQRYIDYALELFGPSRLIWASNWPVSLRGRGYSETLETARETLRTCSAQELAEVLGGTANRVYRLGL